jgi:hypothetical protein
MSQNISNNIEIFKLKERGVPPQISRSMHPAGGDNLT